MSVIFLFLTSLGAVAQTEPGDPEPGGGGDTFSAPAGGPSPGREDRSPLSRQFSVPLSDNQTDRLLRIIRRAERECAVLIVEHRIDCLAQAYRYVARQATGAGYGEASRTLRTLGLELDAIVRENIDRTKPRVSSPRPDRRRPGKRTYRAVKPAAVPKATRAARAAIDKAQNRLLRSAQRSAERRTHYQRIAQAVGSTKLLMRA
ncbi:MAG: hypothetical protein AAGF49_04930 [Pseudomonadota bacterium]